MTNEESVTVRSVANKAYKNMHGVVVLLHGMHMLRLDVSKDPGALLQAPWHKTVGEVEGGKYTYFC